MKPGWDDESFAVAKRMYLEDGASHGDISRALGRMGYTLSRNAVIGKMNRTGVADGRSVIQPKPKAQRVPKPPQAIETIKASKPLPKAVAEHAIQYVGPIDTTPAWGLCQYTRDDVMKPGWQMCGHPAEVKGTGRNACQTPWCESHGRICHQPQQSKKTAAKDAA